MAETPKLPGELTWVRLELTHVATFITRLAAEEDPWPRLHTHCKDRPYLRIDPDVFDTMRTITPLTEEEVAMYAGSLDPNSFSLISYITPDHTAYKAPQERYPSSFNDPQQGSLL